MHQLVDECVSPLLSSPEMDVNLYSHLVCFAMATFYLSRRDQRRASKLRASTPGSDVSDDIILEDELDLDLKKTPIVASPTIADGPPEVPTLEHRHPTHAA